jgi:hypothetical protein
MGNPGGAHQHAELPLWFEVQAFLLGAKPGVVAPLSSSQFRDQIEASSPLAQSACKWVRRGPEPSVVCSLPGPVVGTKFSVAFQRTKDLPEAVLEVWGRGEGLLDRQTIRSSRLMELSPSVYNLRLLDPRTAEVITECLLEVRG